MFMNYYPVKDIPISEQFQLPIPDYQRVFKHEPKAHYTP